jgi:hypothetical protein
MAIILFLYLLALVCWIGAMVFFGFFTAPVIFRVLPIAEAGKVVARLFPRYYALGYVAGGIGLVLALYFTAARSGRAWWVGAAVALTLSLGSTIYAGSVLRPRIDAIRAVSEQSNPDPSRRAEFDRLHRLSVTLNGCVLVLNLAALFSSAAALSSRG